MEGTPAVAMTFRFGSGRGSGVDPGFESHGGPRTNILEVSMAYWRGPPALFSQRGTARPVPPPVAVGSTPIVETVVALSPEPWIALTVTNPVPLASGAAVRVRLSAVPVLTRDRGSMSGRRLSGAVI